MSPRGSKQRKHAPSLKSPRPASFVRAGSSVASLRTMGILEPMMKSAAENGMQGFLEKRGGGRHAPGRAASWLSGFAPWQKRFFVLLPRHAPPWSPIPRPAEKPARSLNHNLLLA